MLRFLKSILTSLIVIFFLQNQSAFADENYIKIPLHFEDHIPSTEVLINGHKTHFDC